MTTTGGARAIVSMTITFAVAGVVYPVARDIVNHAAQMESADPQTIHIMESMVDLFPVLLGIMVLMTLMGSVMRPSRTSSTSDTGSALTRSTERTTEDKIEEVHEAYMNNEIAEPEMERRIGELLEDEIGPAEVPQLLPPEEADA